ncbi:hypothetical protein VIBNISO65_1780046 [Vibrio nigripulchritudo SO65]|nr:hypothetical protein VIBNIAM115_1480045 [Vibrio nigripulchritudo AM115]CCN43304.1 hypothetical protein VIBNIFTn2_50048 [Vibrio nigripulchritudo FTn2]CCN63738.1 hypothetical protein VIBNIPon4_150069 [Vibrio nigripulchritudo POn4]CCN77063.1 hypothetical protein VIBNISO65_1780046 [Vibrio nigripulchritudo SO65]
MGVIMSRTKRLNINKFKNRFLGLEFMILTTVKILLGFCF